MYQLLAQQQSAGGTGLIGLVINIVVLFAIFGGLWTIFTKAGKPGWAAIVPFYNIIVLLQITGKPTWWLILYFVPIANIIVAIIVGIELAKCFGKGGGFAAGLILLPIIFLPLLGFGDAVYQPVAAPVAPAESSTPAV